MKAAVSNIERVLRRYTSASSVEASLRLMRKLGKASGRLTRAEAAELAYLSCGTQDDNRARCALAIQRSGSPAARIVNDLEALLQSHSSAKVEKVVTVRRTGALTVICDGLPRTSRNPQLRAGEKGALDSFPGRMLKELAEEYRKQRTNATTPGFMDGRRIQVRGGASQEWKPHAEAYVIE